MHASWSLKYCFRLVAKREEKTAHLNYISLSKLYTTYHLSSWNSRTWVPLCIWGSSSGMRMSLKATYTLGRRKQPTLDRSIMGWNPLWFKQYFTDFETRTDSHVYIYRLFKYATKVTSFWQLIVFFPFLVGLLKKVLNDTIFKQSNKRL